jgi:predicted nucleic acid-binding Zn ribbon protein
VKSRPGRDREPRKLGDVLSTLMQRKAYARPLHLMGLAEAWQRAAGSHLSGRSRVAQFRDGTLTIEVDSSAQRYELEAFQGPSLLARLQSDASVPRVRRLVFRVGHPRT